MQRSNKWGGATGKFIQRRCAELGISIPTQSLWFYANTRGKDSYFSRINTKLLLAGCVPASARKSGCLGIPEGSVQRKDQIQLLVLQGKNKSIDTFTKPQHLTGSGLIICC